MRMKFLGFAIAAVLLLTSATDWDGVATVDPSGDLPGGGYSIATNAFPKNTVLDVTNLENYRTTRVVVVSGLENSSLLATLSRNAAEALGIRSDSVSRIRMVQPPDDIAYSYLRQLGYLAATNGHTPEDPAETEPEDDLDYYDDLAETESDDESAFVSSEEALAEADPEYSAAEVILIPTDERIPESDEHEIADEYLIPPIEPSAYIAEEDYYEYEDDYEYIDELLPAEILAGDDYPAEPGYYSPFQAPLIGELERGMWYIQVAAYTRPDYVEEEINRIGNEYPLAVQNIGSDTSPLFRVLLGPLNQGESGAMLRRVKSIGYKDAFARRG